MFDAFDATLLARLQFAFTVSFHFIFPSFTIGLASYLAVLEALWLWTGRAVYLDLFKYWLKIFALAFGMGVVSGIVMSYQFGTNWSVFSDKAGPVIGPLMAYEVLTAFFLEAGFLGVMLFGMNRVGKALHFTATLAVAVGTFISAFWILSANSWMQTPDRLRDRRQRPVRAGRLAGGHLQSVLSLPSGAHGACRLSHDRAGGGRRRRLASAARAQQTEGTRVMFSMAMGMITVVAPIQILAGDQHGLNTLEHQPVKVMAMEGHFQSHPDGAPLVLFGWPDMKRRQGPLRGLEIPKLSSLILKHSLDAPLKGLDTVTRSDWPPVPIVFWSFRIMVGLGMLMLLLGLSRACSARVRHRLYDWPLAASAGVAHGAGGLRRGDRGLGDDGGRPPALHGATACCAPPLGVAAAGAGGGDVAAGLHRRLLHRVRRRHLVHPASHGQSPPHGEPGPDRDPSRSAQPASRPHPRSHLAKGALT